jgi:6-phosphogluconolactonase
LIIMRSLLFLLVATMSLSAAAPLVFVSAFTSDEKGGGIHAFGFDLEKGTLKPQHRTMDVRNPFFIAVSPDKKFLYAIDAEKFGGDEDENVVAFMLEGRSGQMKRLNHQSARGTASCFLDVDPTGKAVLVANYVTGNVASLPVKSDGSLGEAVSFFQHSGSSVDPQRQKGPNAHCFVVSPDGKHALACDLGIDKVMIYTLDAASAKLAPNTAQPFAKLTPGSGPRHHQRLRLERLRWHAEGETNHRHAAQRFHRQELHRRLEDHARWQAPLRHESRPRQPRKLPHR